VRLVDVDLEAARAAFEAKDDKAFAAAIAPLGVELDIAKLRRAISSTGCCGIALEALYRAIVDDAGVATARKVAIGDHHVAMAVRLDDRVVFGTRRWSKADKYGWKEIRRWYKDTARNREHMVAWAKQPPLHTVAAKLRARLAAAAGGEGEALLAAVLAAPADDGARLVYADWLLEQGDPRGELIQLECALVERPTDKALAKRAEEVRARCAAGFDKLVDGAPYTIRRGFIDEVTLTVAAYGKRGAALLAAQPVDRLVITVTDQKQLAKLAGLAIPQRLALKLLGRDPPLEELLGQLVVVHRRDPRLEGDHEVSVGRDPPRPTKLNVGVTGIAPLFEGRARVGFEKIFATTEQWAALLGSPACKSVRALELNGCPLEAAIVPVLADRELDSLTIRNHSFDEPLGKPMLEALRRLGARVRRLEGFSWRPRDQFRTVFAALLARSTFEELAYADTPFEQVIVELLAASERSRSLRRLAIGPPDPNVLELLHSSPNLSGLEELHLKDEADENHLFAYFDLLPKSRLKFRWPEAPAKLRAAAPHAFA